ncbi:hypothetical protein RWD73_05055 [Klebsiella pneumoniae]|uniref:hypothetical protein n=1 Tax=Klebsiella pneumoniae TaxID=573 RepID=UPI00293649CD|nr:hypothetical protein [Klebsiella pneumoniae]MDV2906227.1 hypothetical protein [Klebsiella pneumoniae]
MTDITELAQSLKAAAEHYQSVQGIARYSKTADAKERFLELANPANILALVEALEKARRANGYLREQSAEWERKAISNFEECAKLSQRVEELESRNVTVEKLQESAYRAGLTAGWNLGLANNNDGFNKCLAAHTAGIKVEAE